MPLWPFRRKSRRKRGRASTTDGEESGVHVAGSALPPRSQTVPDMVASAPERKASKRQRQEPNKLQRRPRAYSFSPGRHDSLRLSRKRSTRTGQEEDTSLRDGEGVGSRLRDGGIGLGAVADEMLRRVPTLHNKRDGDHLPRKMSSKRRRKDDHQREAEIKAMCSFMPVRPATEDWMAGRPMRKESGRVKTGLGVGIKGPSWDKFNRSSDISLPFPESIDSALSSDSDYISYKVSALEALAPRPTLRYTTHLRQGACARDGAGLPRRPSQQRSKLSDPIPEETLRANKRVDNLADDLSASDLRELMERDQRRRARKRQLDQEKTERRIARRAEKQKVAEAEARRQGRESPPNLERGVLGREDVGLGIDPASAVVTSSRIRRSDNTPKQPCEVVKDRDPEASREGMRADPLAAFHRTDSIPLPVADPPARLEERPVAALESPESRTSLRTKLSRPKSGQESETRTDRSEPPPKGSEAGSSKGSLSWSTFFRWGRKNKRNSGAPSSFSNTSRDSMYMTQAQAQASAPAASFVPRRLTSGIPKRTMSRFREDLPELPISPPASRMQSPDAEAIHSMIGISHDLHHGEVVSPTRNFHRRHDTPTSERRSGEAMRQTPSTFSHPDEPGVSPEPQAMSLASIDSEGSWFSGRLSKKRKSSGILQRTPPLRLQETPESDNERRHGHDSPIEDMSIADDDYLSRLAPSHGDRSALNRKSTGEARPSSDWEEEAHWGSVRGQHPTVVHSHPVGRMKSREGLLKTFGEEGEITQEIVRRADSVDDGDDGEHEHGEGLQRSTSIDLGKAHGRRISAGSARLLSITPRS